MWYCLYLSFWLLALIGVTHAVGRHLCRQFLHLEVVMSWNDLREGRCSIGGEYFITFNTENKQPIFYDFYIARLFCSLLGENECQHDCRWVTWVLMPDHFHGLLR
ncbi:transposase [Shewanella halifaxensis]|uniref:transposase n=1 Tax=Shewanella halifaxensis TaxID=271098 RepID=UPI001F1E94BA|nr:transposase [Shewanella halifaxensis]